jgi:hypothetical protein
MVGNYDITCFGIHWILSKYSVIASAGYLKVTFGYLEIYSVKVTSGYQKGYPLDTQKKFLDTWLRKLPFILRRDREKNNNEER